MRLVKSLEIVIMALAAYGFYTTQVPVLLGCVFLMGLHSTLFGPVKYAYLPQDLSEEELTGGNGMVEMGTFVPHPAGHPGGRRGGRDDAQRRSWLAIALLAVAVLGTRDSQSIPASPATDARPQAPSSTGTRSARPGAT